MNIFVCVDTTPFGPSGTIRFVSCFADGTTWESEANVDNFPF